MAVLSVASCSVFQSALRSGERSDRRSKSDQASLLLFQSALRSGERSDRSAFDERARCGCFNPRSARVSGATSPDRQARSR